VAAGVAECLRVDPRLVRLALVVLGLAAAPILVGYLVAWAILPDLLPQAPPQTRTQTPTASFSSTSQRKWPTVWVIMAAVAITIVWTPLSIFGLGFGGLGFGLGVPVVLLVLAVVLLMGRKADNRPPPPPPPPPPPEDGPVSAYGPQSRPQRPRAPKNRVLTPLTLGVLAVFAGGATVGDLAGWWDANLTVAFGIALLIVGVALAAWSMVGRAVGLIPLGIFLVVCLLFSTALDPIIRDGAGERHLVVTEISQLGAEYRLGAGELALDLTSLELPEGRHQVEVQLAMGDARVYVPEDMNVEVHSSVGAGEIGAFGSFDAGLDVATFNIQEATDDGPDLIVTLNVGAGYGAVESR
jgi:phage shock protein PspC (stress-responsive transcriptional regulator)